MHRPTRISSIKYLSSPSSVLPRDSVDTFISTVKATMLNTLFGDHFNHSLASLGFPDLCLARVNSYCYLSTPNINPVHIKDICFKVNRMLAWLMVYRRFYRNTDLKACLLVVAVVAGRRL